MVGGWKLGGTLDTAQALPDFVGSFPVAATAIFGSIKRAAPRQFRRRAKPKAYWGQSRLPKTMPRNARGAGPATFNLSSLQRIVPRHNPN
jgi:hypothetical protein